MSGDVQPRKRKDKKKKKDDLGIEEPRGTAAALGEGDIFMHSQNEHGTGGHWCAKVIFFSLLAVLITLIGLIILENRGLTDLDANSVESRYSGVLEGWLEDAGDDDHHDEHTLELKHHDEDEDDDHGDELDHDEDLDNDDEHDEHDEDEDDDEGEHSENDDDNDDETQEDENEQDEFNQKENENSEEANDDDDENNDSEEQNLEPAEDDEDIVEERRYRKFYQSSENRLNDDDDDEEDDDLQKGGENNGEDNAQEEDDDDDDDDDDNQLNDADDDDQDIYEKDDDDDDDQRQLNTKNEDDDDDSQENENSNENDADEAQDNEDEEEHEEPEDDSVEVEHIEEEVFDDDVSSDPAPAPVSRQTREADDSREVSKESPRVYDAIDDDVELLEPDELDDDLPDLLPIPSSKAKPLVEVEESPSTETPQDTLAEEEEYERQQEQLRREKEQASQGMWLKLLVGGALLVATQAVLRRATAPREIDNEVDTSREETPLSDRRMTLIAEPVPQPVVTPKVQEAPRPVIKEAPIIFTPLAQETEDVEEEEEIGVTEEEPTVADNVDKELYSDEEEVEDEEEEVEPPKSVPLKVAQSVKEAPKTTAAIKETPKPPVDKQTLAAEKEAMPEEEEYEDDDVEIIEDEELGEELEDEEISDVDDAELLNRLEAKYGRLPEPHRPGTQKDGGNSIEEQWPGEPSDSYWRDELDRAEQDLRQDEYTRALERASAAPLKPSGRARYIVAKALDMSAEAKRDNALLTKAIAAYLELMKMYDRLSDEKLFLVTDRAINRIMFRGNYMGAEPVYRLLIRRFPDVVTYRNNLTVSFLMANRVDLAEEVIKETLSRWPEDRVALAHHGFILKTRHNKLEEAVQAFTKALEGDEGPANEARFYYHLGDSLLLLGRAEEALEVHKRGAKLGHFLSPSQRSLYNVNRLKSKPWWNVEETPYAGLARTLEQSWKEILKEGLAAQELYEKEKEGLMERGEWSQMDLFVRGREVSGRCARAPATCAAVRGAGAGGAGAGAGGCSRGQVKFSAMRPGTHVRAHVGPTNCRLRMHLALANTRHTYIRVDKEIRQWEVGKVLMFDDSFEHEVWHNGTGTRLVLIVDVWHPDLTDEEKLSLPAI